MALLVPTSTRSRRRIIISSGTNACDDSSGAFDQGAGTQLTASATPHALPASPTQLIASTEVEADWVRFYIHGMHVSATLTDALLNIYIGGAGSETLFIDSLSAGWSTTANPAATGLPNTYWFPVRIPRGTRISASLRSLIASDTCRVMVEYGSSGGAHWVGSGVETLGENTSLSRGTAITPATTGSGWTTIGTTGRRYRHISLGVQGNNDTTVQEMWTQWYIGTGSAILQHVGGIRTRLDVAECHEFRDAGRWCDIPSGTSLQLNAYSTQAASGNQFVTLHGVY